MFILNIRNSINDFILYFTINGCIYNTVTLLILYKAYITFPRNLRQHEFVTGTRSPTVLKELILKTKMAVRDLDNLQYKKIRDVS